MRGLVNPVADHITDKAVTVDATEKRFPGGRCLCTPQDPCPCSGQLVRYCPCYRDEAARLDATASKVVVPTTPGPIPGVAPTAKAKLDAIEVDLRGGYVRSGEHIAEDPDEYRDEQFVNVADLPSIIHAWASAALPVLNTTTDEAVEPNLIMGTRPDGSPWVISAEFVGPAVRVDGYGALRLHGKAIAPAAAHRIATGLLAAITWLESDGAAKAEAAASLRGKQ